MAIARKLLAVLLCMALFGCTSGNVNKLKILENTKESKKEVEVEPEALLVWSYTDEILKEISAFEELNNAVVTLDVMDMNGFVQMAAGVIKSGLNMPDILILEESQIDNDVLAPLLSDLEAYGTKTEYLKSMSPYAVEKGRTSDGILIGLSYQVSPVAIYYRRSMATEVFGTDDPVLMSDMFSSYSNLSDGLDLLNQSNIKMFSDIFTLREFSNLNERFIGEDGLFNREALSREYFELLKKAQVEKQVAFETKWSDLWLQGMYKPITNSYGTDMRVFAYILPSWGLSNILMLTGDEVEPLLSNEDGSIQVFNPTSGDWGLASLKKPYSSGSSYLTLNKASEHVDLGLAFIKYMCSYQDHDGQWLTMGDMVSSIPSIQSKQEFPEGDIFLGGQNFQQTMGDIGQEIKVEVYENKELETKNTMIQKLFDEFVIRFIQGDFHTIDEAIAVFETQIEEMYPELFTVVTPE